MQEILIAFHSKLGSKNYFAVHNISMIFALVGLTPELLVDFIYGYVQQHTGIYLIFIFEQDDVYFNTISA